MEDLRYPIGKFEPREYSDSLREEWLTDIRFLPQHLENAILNLDDMQLETPYREGGWTVKQVVHHVADSHMNAYIRFKLRLTEESLIIKPYDEKAWAEMVDTRKLPVNISLTLLHALHARWHMILKNLDRADWDKKAIHPEYNKEYSLWDLLGLYSWHSRHHVAHINSLRERMKW